jgi:hypothetical protein
LKISACLVFFVNIIKKAILNFRTGKIIIIKRDLNPVAIDYQSSLSFELSDACQIEETKYILVINYISHTEYPSISTNEPTTLIIVVPKTISMPVIDTVELNSILINPI